MLDLAAVAAAPVAVSAAPALLKASPWGPSPGEATSLIHTLEPREFRTRVDAARRATGRS